MKPIKLFSAWFGGKPPWWGRYVDQMAALKTVDWEHVPPLSTGEDMFEHVRWFNRLGTARLGTPCNKWGNGQGVPIHGMCDFRPTYGELFADRIAGHDWWGWIDLDMALGRFDEIVAELLTDDVDVLTFKPEHLSGCLSLFRNHPEVNGAFRRGPWRKILADPDYHIWDESGKDKGLGPNVHFRRYLRDAGLRIAERYDLYSYTTQIQDDYSATQKLEMIDGRLMADGFEVLFCHFMDDKWPL